MIPTQSTVYWINLNRSLERREHMELLLKNNKNIRIEAIDGVRDDITKYITKSSFHNTTLPEYGCLLSHLKAIKTFYEEDPNDYCGIAEDDASTEFLHNLYKRWESFDELIKTLPMDWEIFQISSICNDAGHFFLRNCKSDSLPRIQNVFWSTCFYFLNKKGASKIMKYYDKERNLWNLDPYIKPIADVYLYDVCKTYTSKYAYITYKTEYISLIQDNNHSEFHKRNKINQYNNFL